MNLWLWFGCMVVALGVAVWAARKAIVIAVRGVAEEDLPDEETAL